MINITINMSFGDCMLFTALMRQLSYRYGAIGVYTRPQYQDAFYNLPYVRLLSEPDPDAHDFTPWTHFERLKRKHDWDLSLLDLPWLLASECELLDAPPDQSARRPQLLPTSQEKENVARFLEQLPAKPLVALESAFFSGQSWWDAQATELILDYYGQYCQLLWLSPQDIPEHPAVLHPKQLTRRECILLTEHCTEFISSGSGMFCGSLALDFAGRTTCLWKDAYFRYETRMAQLQWKQISWVHDHNDLKSRFAHDQPSCPRLNLR